jgi:hypothetical protein
MMLYKNERLSNKNLLLFATIILEDKLNFLKRFFVNGRYFLISFASISNIRDYLCMFNL